MNSTALDNRSNAPRIARPLLIGAYAFPGGDATSNRLLQLARSAAPEGASTLVVNDWPWDLSWTPRSDVGGIQLITLRTRGANRLTRMIARVARPFRVIKALRDHHVDRSEVSVVILPMVMLTLGTWVVIKVALRCPVVVDASERHDRRQFERGWLTPYFLRHRWSTFLATRLVNRATAVSTTLASYLQNHGMEVLVVPPQVDCSEFTPSRLPSMKGGLRLLYAGTPGRKDMLDVIVRGIRQLSPDEQRRVQLVIAGVTRAEASALSDLDVGLLDRLSARVEFLGRVPRAKVLELLSDSHFAMLVRPIGGYAANGFPSKVPESLAAGCPVMLNHTSDLVSYVQDGVEGVVLAANTPDAVEEGVRRALQITDREWVSMSQAARSRALGSFDYRSWRERTSTYMVGAGESLRDS